MSAKELSVSSIKKERGTRQLLKDFIQTVPDGVLPQGYDIRTLWESAGKPSDINVAENIGMLPKNESGEYDLPAVDKKTGKWLTPFNKGEMFKKELEFYNSNLPDAQEMKKQFRLNTSDKYWRYEKREEGEIPIYDERGLTIGYKSKDGRDVIDKKKPVIHDGKFVGFYNTNTGSFEKMEDSNYDNQPSVTRMKQSGQRFVKQNATEDNYVSQEKLREMKDLQDARNASQDVGEELPEAMTPPTPQPRVVTKEEAMRRIKSGEKYKITRKKV